jgi:hypothetical protein
MKRILTIVALIFGLASFTALAQNAAPQGDDSFAKYGQEFKARLVELTPIRGNGIRKVRSPSQARPVYLSNCSMTSAFRSWAVTGD